MSSGIIGLSREDLLQRAGNTNQLYGVKQVTFEDGRARGMSAYQVNTGGGLSVDVLPDNGLDLGSLSFRGVNISYMSKNGYVAAPFAGHGALFPTSYAGGMMYTCGLLNVGPGNDDAGVWHPAHGRIHSIGAESRAAQVDEYSGVIRLSGVLRESALFQSNLRLARTITLPIGGSSLTIEDTLTNLTPETAEYMILYHVNFGYPFLDESLRLALPEGTATRPHTEHAAAGIREMCSFPAPIDGYEEQVYLHTLPAENGVCSLRAENSALGMGAKLSYSQAALPYLAQWKSMGSGDYALGLEPTNTLITGRANERKERGLPTLEGFGEIKLKVALELYDL